MSVIEMAEWIDNNVKDQIWDGILYMIQYL